MNDEIGKGAEMILQKFQVNKIKIYEFNVCICFCVFLLILNQKY